MTQEDFDKAPLLDQILYDETGMLVKNNPSMAEAMEKYHQAKLKSMVSSSDVSKPLDSETQNHLNEFNKTQGSEKFTKKRFKRPKYDAKTQPLPRYMTEVDHYIDHLEQERDELKEQNKTYLELITKIYKSENASWWIKYDINGRLPWLNKLLNLD